MVKTVPFRDIEVPSPGFGAMGISFGLGSNLSLEEAEPVLLKAIELGCTFWDTAVSSVTMIWNLADTVRLSIKRESTSAFLASLSGNTTFVTRSSVRNTIFRVNTSNKFNVVASKCGFNCMNGGDGSVTNSASHIKEYIEGTIERLGFTPDLYYLHRIDPSKSFNSIRSPYWCIRYATRRINSCSRWDPKGWQDQVHWTLRMFSKDAA